MSFQLFLFKCRKFIGIMIRLNREQTAGFVLDQLSDDLAELKAGFDRNRDYWTGEQFDQGFIILDEISLRMDLQEAYWDYQTANCCTDNVGNFCLN